MRWLKVTRDLQFLKENGTYIICKTESWLIKYSIKKKISESLTYICMYQSPRSQNYFMLLQIIHGSQSYACQRWTDNLIENRNLKVKYLLMMLIFKAYGMLSSEMIFSCRVNCFCTCLLGELQGRQTMSGEKVFVVMPQGFFFLLIIMNEIGRVSQRNLFLPPQIKEERKCYPNYEMQSHLIQPLSVQRSFVLVLLCSLSNKEI